MKNFKVFSVLFIGLLIIFSATLFSQEKGSERIKTTEAMTIKEDTPQQKDVPAKQEKILPKQEEQKPAEQAEDQAKKAEDTDAQKRTMTLEDFEKYLEDYGEWIESEEYGKAWVPYANKEKDWGPYRKGMWEDYGNQEECYYWRSLEPFGHIVYHYGRWHYNQILGWYWIPTYVWGPAWVNWFWYGSYTYWSPMWVDGFDSWYFRQHYDRYYGRSNSIGWTVVHKDQLKNSNLHRAIRSAQQTNLSSPIQITNTQLKPNVTPSQNRITNNTNSVKSYSSSNKTVSRAQSPTQQKFNGRIAAKYANAKPNSLLQKAKPTVNPRATVNSRQVYSRTQNTRTSPYRISNQSRLASSRTSSLRSSRSRISGSSRISAPARSSAPRSTAVRSSSTRSSASARSSSRLASSRGTVVRKK